MSKTTLPSNKITGFTGHGIQEAGKKGGKLSKSCLDGAQDHSLYAEQKVRHSLANPTLPGANDKTLIKSA